MLVVRLFVRDLERRAAGEALQSELAPLPDERHEDHHLAVGRNRRRLLQPVKIRQTFEVHVPGWTRLRILRRRTGRLTGIERRIPDVAQAVARVLLQTSPQQQNQGGGRSFGNRGPVRSIIVRPILVKPAGPHPN
jgi:hypothetical protein